MNLELIKEIESLKDDDKTYTEIAEITGLARTGIVLSLRLSKIFHTSYSQKISSLESNIEILNSTIKQYKDSGSKKEAEIKVLKSLSDIDCQTEMIVKKDEFKNLEDELEKSHNEVDTLKRKLYYKEQYFKNLSFIDKMNILFS